MGTDSRRIGKYELRQRLGRGGMAEVWKAWDTQLERFVAIKLLHADLQNDPDFMKRFVREARVVASLHHPNIVQVHDFQISNPPESESIVAYMVMDYVEGLTLADYIRSTSRVGRFPPATNIVHLFTAIGRAIDYAHQRGMIHRDIKPANILLDQRNTTHHPIGEPILTDFGIVKLLGSSTATLSGAWMGTPIYISPEQAQGYAGNERSDIYSLGVILYEISTGVRPFTGDSPVAIIMQHIQAMPTPPALINPTISPALTEVIMRSLAKDPTDRFPSASSMATSLAHAINMSTPTNPASPPYTTSGMSEPSNRSPWQTNVPLNMTPPSPASPPVVSSTAQFPTSLYDGQGTTMTPTHSPAGSDEGTPFDAPLDRQGAVNSTPAVSSNQYLSDSTPSSANLHVSVTPVFSPPSTLSGPTPSRRRRALLVGLLAALIIVLLSSGLGTFYLLTHRNPAAIQNSLAGQAFFESTVSLNDNTAQGINDKLHIILNNISNPDPAKSYYAWLLPDKDNSQVTPLFLGTLSVKSGAANFTLSGDPQHHDLLATFSRLLITEETAKSVPAHPSTDQSSWRYFAQLPQKNKSTDDPPLVFIRYLFTDNTNLPPGIHGGWASAFLRNTQKILDLANIATDSSQSKNATAVRNTLITILDYLDGVLLVNQDVPVNTPFLADQTLAQISLINIGSSATNPSYLGQFDSQIVSLVRSPDLTTDMHKIVTQAESDLINNVDPWLMKVHDDAAQLLKLQDAQLLQTPAGHLLNEMQTYAHYAYYEKDNYDTSTVEYGSNKIYQNLQGLITFNITHCPCST